MRQMISSASVKAIYIDRASELKKLELIAKEAGRIFSEIKEIRLFGSLAKMEETGLSDIDLFILVDSPESDPLERAKPYFNFLSEHIDLAIDVLVANENEASYYSDLLKDNILLYLKSGVKAGK